MRHILLVFHDSDMHLVNLLFTNFLESSNEKSRIAVDSAITYDFKHANPHTFSC